MTEWFYHGWYRVDRQYSPRGKAHIYVRTKDFRRWKTYCGIELTKSQIKNLLNLDWPKCKNCMKIMRKRDLEIAKQILGKGKDG